MFFSFPQKVLLLQKTRFFHFRTGCQLWKITCFFHFRRIAEKNVIHVFFFRGKKHYPYGDKYFPRKRVVTGVGKDGLQLSPPCPFPLPVTGQEVEIKNSFAR